MILRNLTGGRHADARRIIVENTEVSREHLTPEIALHLITPNCPLWHQTDEQNVFHDPFWAFYWPGGQVLTRYNVQTVLRQEADQGFLFKGALDFTCFGIVLSI